MLRMSAIICLSLFLFVTPVRANVPTPEKSPEKLLSEGMRSLMQAMKLFMQNLPQFGEPYINENGDIVIPQVQPKNPPSEPAEKSEEKGKRQI